MSLTWTIINCPLYCFENFTSFLHQRLWGPNLCLFWLNAGSSWKLGWCSDMQTFWSASDNAEVNIHTERILLCAFLQLLLDGVEIVNRQFRSHLMSRWEFEEPFFLHPIDLRRCATESFDEAQRYSYKSFAHSQRCWLMEYLWRHEQNYRS